MKENDNGVKFSAKNQGRRKSSSCRDLREELVAFLTDRVSGSAPRDISMVNKLAGVDEKSEMKEGGEEESVLWAFQISAPYLPMTSDYTYGAVLQSEGAGGGGLPR